MRAPKTRTSSRKPTGTSSRACASTPSPARACPTYGTNVLTNVINEAGGYPTNNFKRGRFDGCSKISGETQAADRDRARRRRLGHPRLPPRLRHPVLRHLQRQGRPLPDQAAGVRDGLGPRRQLRHRRPRRHRHAGPPGRQHRPGHDRDGGHHRRGHGGRASSSSATRRAAIRLVKEVGKGTPLGRILGSGAGSDRQGLRRRAGAGGQGPGHAGLRPAGRPGHRRHLRHQHPWAPTTPPAMPSPPTSSSVGGNVDPLKPEGQIELSRNLQIATAAIDSTGMCLFIAFAILDQPETFQALLDMLGCFYGTATDRRRRGRRWAKSILKHGAGIQHAGPASPRSRTGCRDYFNNEPLAAAQRHLHDEGRGAGPGIQLVDARGYRLTTGEAPGLPDFF